MRQGLMRVMAAIGAAGSTCALFTDATPWVYPELTRGIELRREKEARLRHYVAQMGPVVASLSERASRCKGVGVPKESQVECEKILRDYEAFVRKVERETSQLTWGSVENQARRRAFVKEYGCSGWTGEALDEIKRYSPIVELGAGNGQWQKALVNAGADVVAYDNFSALPLPAGDDDDAAEAEAIGGGERNSSRSTTGVIHGSESVLSSSSMKCRTLLVVYPEGDLLERCLMQYTGDVLLFVGEGRGGVNGSNHLFDTLERDWQVLKVLPVKPFEGGYERLWVCRRRRKR